MSFQQRIDAARGDQGAMNEFLAEWRRRLRSASRDLLGEDVTSRADTSDVTQESLVQFWKDLGGFRGDSEGECDAWAQRIAKGQAAKLRRFHHAQKRNVRQTKGEVDGELEPQPSPQAEAVRREELSILSEAIEALDEPMQRVIFLYFFEGRTFRAIARRMEVSERVVRGTFTRALKRLKSGMRVNGSFGISGVVADDSEA